MTKAILIALAAVAACAQNTTVALKNKALVQSVNALLPTGVLHIDNIASSSTATAVVVRRDNGKASLWFIMNRDLATNHKFTMVAEDGDAVINGESLVLGNLNSTLEPIRGMLVAGEKSLYFTTLRDNLPPAPFSPTWGSSTAWRINLQTLALEKEARVGESTTIYITGVGYQGTVLRVSAAFPSRTDSALEVIYLEFQLPRALIINGLPYTGDDLVLRGLFNPLDDGNPLNKNHFALADAIWSEDNQKNSYSFLKEDSLFSHQLSFDQDGDLLVNIPYPSWCIVWTNLNTGAGGLVNASGDIYGTPPFIQPRIINRTKGLQLWHTPHRRSCDAGSTAAFAPQDA